MSKKIEELADRYFGSEVTKRDRAVFEAGVALGSILHQFVGIPVTGERKTLRSLSRAVEATMMLQPYRKNVTVRLNPRRIKKNKRHPYDYRGLSEKDMDVAIKISYRGVDVTARMKYAPEIDYPLMSITAIEERVKRREP